MSVMYIYIALSWCRTYAMVSWKITNSQTVVVKIIGILKSFFFLVFHVLRIDRCINSIFWWFFKIFFYISFLQHTYSKEDCTFREQILPDGYNVYRSVSHGALISLGNHRQHLKGEDRSDPSMAQFLPRISTLDQDFNAELDGTEKPAHTASQRVEPGDAVGLFGELSQMIDSPSFHKRWDSWLGDISTCVLDASGLRPSPVGPPGSSQSAKHYSIRNETERRVSKGKAPKWQCLYPPSTGRLVVQKQRGNINSDKRRSREQRHDHFAFRQPNVTWRSSLAQFNYHARRL